MGGDGPRHHPPTLNPEPQTLPCRAVTSLEVTWGAMDLDIIKYKTDYLKLRQADDIFAALEVILTPYTSYPTPQLLNPTPPWTLDALN